MPRIEEREACRFSGYKWKEWGRLGYDERVECVAYFRVKRRMEMNQQDARDRDMQRKMREQQQKRRRR